MSANLSPAERDVRLAVVAPVAFILTLAEAGSPAAAIPLALGVGAVGLLIA